jgi:hypothetical protein
MINYTIKVIGTHSTGASAAIDFSVTGSDSETANKEVVTTMTIAPGITADSLPGELLLACQASAEFITAKSVILSRIVSAKTPMYDPSKVVVDKPVIPDDVQRERWMLAVDDTVAAVLGKFTRFEMGYTQREAAATAYKAAGYTGDPTIWITRFADNNSMSYTDTADLILAQAEGYRAALEQLEALRMDKYKISRAANLVAAKVEFDTIMAQCMTIYENLT